MAKCACGCGRETPVKENKFFSRSCVLRSFLQDELFTAAVGRDLLEEALRFSEELEKREWYANGHD